MNFTEHVKIREEKFGTVIFETLREKIFITNQTGKSIVDLLQKGYSTEKIISILTEGYNDEDGRIKSDAIEFIEQLKANKIIA